MGRHGELTDLLSLALQTEICVGCLELVVSISDDEEGSINGLSSREGFCPHCGDAVRVTVNSVLVVSADE